MWPAQWPGEEQEEEMEEEMDTRPGVASIRRPQEARRAYNRMGGLEGVRGGESKQCVFKLSDAYSHNAY